jgi:hypothetical protein
MARLILIAVLLILLAAPAMAQQDPDDPGIQDSLIIRCNPNCVDSANAYQPVLVQIYAVTDDSIMRYNLPLRWFAPLGGVSPTGVNTQYFFPIDQWDIHFDSVMATENYIRHFGIAIDPDPPLLAPQRQLAWTLRFIVAPNAPAQWVVIDTCYDLVVGSTALGDRTGQIVITPAVKSGLLLIWGPWMSGVGGEIREPNKYALGQNHPNPFNARTTIEYKLPKAGLVELAVFNIAGQRVAVLDRGTQPAGEHWAVWDASGLPSGIYFYRLLAGDFIDTKRMLLLK